MNLIEFINKAIYDASIAKSFLTIDEIDKIYDSYLKQYHISTVDETIDWTSAPKITGANMGYHFDDEYITCHYDTLIEYNSEDIIDLFLGYENKHLIKKQSAY